MLSQCFVSSADFNCSSAAQPLQSSTLKTTALSTAGQTDGTGLKKLKHQLVASIPINVLLCEAKVDSSVERRHCFELISSQRSYVLQAESDAEVNLWLNTIDAAKQWAVQESSPSDTTLSRKTIGKMPVFVLDKSCYDEDDDGERFYRVLNTAGSLILLENVQDELSFIDLNAAGEHRPTAQLDSDQSASPKAALAAAELEKNESSAPLVQYSDSSLMRRNEELHTLLKSVPKSDMVLHMTTCALKRDVLIQGRLYLTQNRVCFYSSIMGFTTVFVIQLANVNQMHCRRLPLHVSMVFYMVDGSQNVFKMFIKGATKTYSAIKAAWLNVTDPNLAASGTAKSPQELYEFIQQQFGSSSGTASLGSSVADEAKDDDATVPALAPIGSGEQTAEDANNESSTEDGALRYPDGFVEPSAPIPSSISVSENPILEREDFNAIINLPAKTVADLLMSENIEFWQKYHSDRNDKDLHFEPFTVSETGERQRKAKYIVQVSNPMVKVKETECLETQTILKEEEYVNYVLDARQSTPALPYADAFQPCCQFSVTFNSRTSCRVAAYIGVKWFKSPLVKSIIKSAALKGLSESCALILANLEKAAASSSSLGRNKSRQTKNAAESSTEKSLETASTPHDSQGKADIVEGASKTIEHAPKSWWSSKTMLSTSLALLLLSIVSLLSSMWLNQQNLALLEHGISSLSLLAGVGFQCAATARNASFANQTLTLARGYGSNELSGFCQRLMKESYYRWLDFVHAATDSENVTGFRYFGSDSEAEEPKAVLMLLEEFFQSHFEEFSFRKALTENLESFAKRDSKEVHQWNDTFAFKFVPSLELELLALLKSAPKFREDFYASRGGFDDYNLTLSTAQVPDELLLVYLPPQLWRNLTALRSHGLAHALGNLANRFKSREDSKTLLGVQNDTNWKRFSQLAVAQQQLKVLRQHSVDMIGDLERKEKQLLHLLVLHWMSSLAQRCREAAEEFVAANVYHSNGSLRESPQYSDWPAAVGRIDKLLQRSCPLLTKVAKPLNEHWNTNVKI